MKLQTPRILLITLLLPLAASSNSSGEVKTKPEPTAHVTTAKSVKTDPAVQTPVTYAGRIPCADCPGIDYTLNLLSDGIALQRFTYLEAENGRDLSFVELMLWWLTRNGRQLLLEGNSEDIQRFAVKNERTLSMLDRRGKPIRSGLNYDLVRADKVDIIEGPLSLRGYYRYVANTAIFKECQTGKSFPVSQEADGISLKSAYLNAVEKKGEPLYMALKGRLAMRSMEGRDRETLSVIPERLGQVRMHEHCP